jgi:hypothetical protein
MKRATFSAVVMLALCVAGANAGDFSANGYRTFPDLKSYQDVSFERVARSYLGSLEYRGCNEIVEGGLAQIAMLKLAQPNGEHKAVEKQLNALALDGETPTVRYKAYLTSMVFTNPNLFTGEKFGDYNNGDELFTALAQRLQKEALAAK